MTRLSPEQLESLISRDLDGELSAEERAGFYREVLRDRETRELYETYRRIDRLARDSMKGSVRAEASADGSGPALGTGVPGSDEGPASRVGGDGAIRGGSRQGLNALRRLGRRNLAAAGLGLALTAWLATGPGPAGRGVEGPEQPGGGVYRAGSASRTEGKAGELAAGEAAGWPLEGGPVEDIGAAQSPRALRGLPVVAPSIRVNLPAEAGKGLGLGLGVGGEGGPVIRFLMHSDGAIEVLRPDTPGVPASVLFTSERSLRERAPELYDRYRAALDR